MPMAINSVRGRPSGRPRLFSSVSPLCHRQPLSTEPLGKSLRVLHLGKAEHHEVAAIAACQPPEPLLDSHFRDRAAVFCNPTPIRRADSR
jgi:hypothetical protein